MILLCLAPCAPGRSTYNRVGPVGRLTTPRLLLLPPSTLGFHLVFPSRSAPPGPPDSLPLMLPCEDSLDATEPTLSVHNAEPAQALPCEVPPPPAAGSTFPWPARANNTLFRLCSTGRVML